MKNNLAQRLQRVLMQDKSVEPERLLPALKSDLRDILREYAELNGDVSIQTQESSQGYNLILIASVKRFKA